MFRTVRHLPLARLLIVAELVMLAREHFLKLEPDERRRFLELVRRGRGRKRNLSDRERRELERLIAKAEPRVFAGAAVRRAAGLRKTKPGPPS
jgi:hypothetical protein